MNPSETPVSGSCLCGRVAFEVDEPVKWCGHCHCHLCRRAHGAAFVTWFGVDEPQFRLTAGEADLRWFASSPEAKRGFCGHCGSTLFFTSTRWPGEMHIALSCAHRSISKAPSAHVYWDRRVPWVRVEPDALRKLGGPTGIEPLKD